MHLGDEIPCVDENSSLSQAIVEMTAKRLGMTAIVNDTGVVTGIYTDGDLRRTLDSGLDPHNTPISDAMTAAGGHILPDALATEAAHLMQKHSIQGLLVINRQGKLVGALNFQDLLRAGVV